MKYKNYLSAVLYYKENQIDLIDFISKLYTKFEENFVNYEIIIVDDSNASSSLDKELLKITNVDKSKFKIIKTSYSQGVELSLSAGIDLAIGDYIITFDYLINNKEIFEKTIECFIKCTQGYDVVEYTFYEELNLLNKIFYKIFNAYSYSKINIYPQIFSIISRKALNQYKSIFSKNIFRKAQMSYSGLRILSLKSDTVFKNFTNYDNVNKSKKLEFATDNLILFTSFFSKISIIISVFFISTSLFMSFYTFYFFITKNTIEGWATTMLFLSFSFLGIFFILFIITRYLDLLLRSVYIKNTYLINKITKI